MSSYKFPAGPVVVQYLHLQHYQNLIAVLRRVFKIFVHLSFGPSTIQQRFLSRSH